jgi:hypothetical protein
VRDQTLFLQRIIAGVLLAAAAAMPAQAQTVGLFINEEQASEGITLFGPVNNTAVYLISNDGLQVHAWETSRLPRSMGYLLENGNLLRAADPGTPSIGTFLQTFDWDGTLVWEYSLTSSVYRAHHDIEPLPNGNVLVIARETKSTSEAREAGRDPLGITEGEVRTEAILEIHPLSPSSGEIVWEWHLWDHLIQDFDPTKQHFGVVADHPELVDINYGPSGADWLHSNGLDYNPDLDQIIISSRNFSEFWVIDHSTTSAEAAGHSGGNSGKGGDILYRWGNPATYRRGTITDQQLFSQHDTQWIPSGHPGAGNILIFSNGNDRPGGEHSTIEEITPPVDEFGTYTIAPAAPYGPDDPTWTYSSTPPTEFFAASVSGTQRMPNGNTLVCEGPEGHLFEVTPAGQRVWEYINPVDADGPIAQGDPPTVGLRVFKIRRYPLDYTGFAGKDLTPGDPIELFNPPLPVHYESLLATKLSATGDQIRVEWDAVTCKSSDYHLLFGSIGDVSTLQLSGAECNIGFSGTFAWTSLPAGSLFFLVVGTDDTGVYESSWGSDDAGGERHGTEASFQCGVTTKVVSSGCP